MNHWLVYWRPLTLLNAIYFGGKLDHTAGQQYKRISVGDTLWIVGSIKAGNLTLLGKQRVDRLIDQDTAEAEQGEMLWESDFHAMSDKPLAKVCIPLRGNVIKSLRFIGKSQSLPANFSGCHLQTTRKLSKPTIETMEDLWTQRKSLDQLAKVQKLLRANLVDEAKRLLTVN